MKRKEFLKKIVSIFGIALIAPKIILNNAKKTNKPLTENYPIYGQIECPVCKGFGIIEIESGIKELFISDTSRESEKEFNLRRHLAEEYANKMLDNIYIELFSNT